MLNDLEKWAIDVARKATDSLSVNGQSAHHSDILESAIGAIRMHVDSGEIYIDPDDVIRAAVEKAIDSDNRRAKAVIRKLRTGQRDLDLGEIDDFKQVIVKLGDGARKPWGKVNQNDLDMLDKSRWDNFRRAGVAYEEWREFYEQARGALRNYRTLSDAFDDGIFGGPE